MVNKKEKIQMRELKNFFHPNNIAVIGASRNPNKIGHIIYKNIVEGKSQKNVFPVNITGEEVMGKKSYTSVLNIKEKIDLSIIAIPANKVLKVVEECKKKNINDLIIISAGFREIGNDELEQKLKNFLKENKMNCIGVNCLGIYDSYNNIDAIFIPQYRMKRPEKGVVSFICQSGAIGAAVMDLAADNLGISKFISYGNATDVDESDLINYLSEDNDTKIICLYFEGIKDGEKFFSTLKRVSRKKPIIALKGGISEEGSRAVISHTGALAGSKEVFNGIFQQTGIINVDSLEEFLLIAGLFEKLETFNGNKIQIITNGGGYGILTVDAISYSHNLQLAKFSEKIKKELRKKLPEIISIRNPLDLLGDASTEQYETALEYCIKDKNIDIILVIVLYQTPLIDTNIVEVITSFKQNSTKPIIVVSTGSEFTKNLSKNLEKNSIPVFTFPENAIKALDKITGYYEKRK